MNKVKRLYVEKIEAYAGKARALKEEINSYLGVKQVEAVRILIRYDVENAGEKVFEEAKRTVFSEPPVDLCFEEEIPVTEDETVFSVEYLPGQFDQRADSAEQCLKLLGEDEDPVIKTAVTYVMKGALTESELAQIKSHCINPVDSRESKEAKPATLEISYEEPERVKILDGFTQLSYENLQELYKSLGLAMTEKDFLHIQNYFKEEQRDPSMTEIRVLDTYWSDHCRHTTFSTELESVTFGEGKYKEVFEKTYQDYQKTRDEVWGKRDDKYVCLMDLALIAMRKLKQEGKLQDQEESEEINACSIVVPIEVDGQEEEWLINFKNETHNHPTEIEPFGGAATCLGGAIRDPLSGRTYVYQAMRVTGAADPTKSLKDTLRGKLPQKKIVREAADGYSSYGNQIGLATGLVKEIYHPDYAAKRMEIGAVLGAAPRRNVIRETSDPGDIIILLGGRTGRDGCGGATGSSKVHTEQSIESCGAEVQKGNPPTERKIQRLFRRAEVSKLIKKCNDFGAGGVSVAIGELADGLHIDLDKVPKKYTGLDGTEIAISESQERMAVVVSPEDVTAFLNYAEEENLEAVEVAVVTEDPRLVLMWKGEEIVNISRAFLDTNGARQTAEVFVEIPERKEQCLKEPSPDDVKAAWMALLQDLNVCSQKGLVEMFDSSIGAGTVLMPYGGKYQMTEIQTMAAKVPVEEGHTDAVTLMSYGFDPYLSSWSPYHGAVYAVLESVAKIVAAGGDYHRIRFTFQEYFRRMTEEPSRWSQPFSALLGAYEAQMKFGLPAIGGKDSMSGTFQDIDVPPTLVSFAVAVGKQEEVISPELKAAGNKLAYIKVKTDENDLPDYDSCMRQYDQIAEDMKAGRVISAYALNRAGIAAAISNMALGNRVGVRINKEVLTKDALFASEIGSILVEIQVGMENELLSEAIFIGETIAEECLYYDDMKLTLAETAYVWMKTLDGVFPVKPQKSQEVRAVKEYQSSHIYQCKNKIAKPRVFIPVFPGTNCEYDSKRAFEKAGAEVDVKVFKNLTAQQIRESAEEFSKAVEQAQIVMFPGGFSAGDEPDGSAKFFAAAFRNNKLKESVEKLLAQRDGLMLGICNGFQALIKLGLVPEGRIVPQQEDSPTLTYNTIGRHISTMVYTKVVSNKSPWLMKARLGGVYVNPASHGEGRFAASQEWIQKLEENGQIATQYTDIHGNVTMEDNWNPNGSFGSIEGITSPDGRVFGKMAHAERIGKGVAINIYGEQDLQLFESGVAYFR